MATAGVPPETAEGVAKLAAMLGVVGEEPLSDPMTLWRFYSARDGNISAAAAMYKETVEWRARFSIESVMKSHGSGEVYSRDGSRASRDPSKWEWRRHASITPEAALAERYGFSGRLEKLATDGSPVAVWRLGQADVAGYAREGLLEVMERAFAAHLEDMLQCARSASHRSCRIIRCRMIIDAQGISAAALWHRKVIQRIISLGKAYFPEINASVTIVNAPAVFARLWVMVRSQLTPVMRRKICIVGSDFETGLLEHSGLQLADLPAFLGGTAADTDICAAEPVPDGVGRAGHFPST
ncbi:unnamed protein product [Polarella glacialis]|uniref:CRAL-TRIO domain-containing protein n=1 Tax=Polarella glacialis TaxID=89957 RepID=A0A813FK41_POLGL|nr:unnamed protein product [Polarella glacialis]